MSLDANAIASLLRRLVSRKKDRPILIDALRTLPRSTLVEHDAIRSLLAVMTQLALEQAHEKCQSTYRDKLIARLATLVWELQIVTQDLVPAIAALLACPGWYHGQIIGCITAGVAAETRNGHVLRPLLPLLERCMLQSSSEDLQRAAKTALSLIVLGEADDCQGSDDLITGANTNWAASSLSNDALFELLRQ